VEEVRRKKSFSMLRTKDVSGAAFCESILFTGVEGSHIKRISVQDKYQLLSSKIAMPRFPSNQTVFCKLANASPSCITFCRMKVDCNLMC